jgi:hypothetical protein
MKSCNDLEFLDSYWKEAKKIAKNIKEQLPKVAGIDFKDTIYESKKSNAIMFIVNYSDLKNSWSPKDIIGRSEPLEALAEKIERMILKGNACNVKRMIESIGKNKMKKHKLYHYSEGKSSLGHFRWNYQVYVLNKFEISRVREFFSLNIESYKMKKNSLHYKIGHYPL